LEARVSSIYINVLNISQETL